jgi:hypothetical protein
VKKQETGKSGFPRDSRTGFVPVPNYVMWAGRLLKHSEFRVLITLAMYNPCYPSYTRLMELTGITNRRTISTILKSLQSKSMITVKKVRLDSKRVQNLYTINHPTKWTDTRTLIKEKDAKAKNSPKVFSKKSR